VHRYEGHAVRKNVAARHGMGALRYRWQPGMDPWAVLPKTWPRPARRKRAICCRGGCTRPHKAECRVPMLPYSREIKWLADLKRDLVADRLALRQVRQQDCRNWCPGLLWRGRRCRDGWRTGGSRHCCICPGRPAFKAAAWTSGPVAMRRRAESAGVSPQS
jgi:hypothetical protein